jgi:multidrug efflux system membrane fusion protein
MLTRPVERVTEPVKSPDPAVNGDAPAALPGEARAHASPAAPLVVPAERPRRHFWRWLFVIALAGAAWHYRAQWLPLVAALRSGSNGPAAKASRPVPVRTARVEERDMPDFINGLGTVTAFKTVTLKSRVDGELVKVAFTEGQMVEEGNLLAEIDPRPFEAQLEQAEGTLAKDEASLELARLNLIRVKELKKSNSIAQQQVDEQVAMVQQLEGTVQTDRGLVANARLQLSYCRIVAPVSGRIGLRLVDQGNIVHANDVMGMAVITQLQPIALVFPVSQDEIPRVQKRVNEGQTLTVLAYDRNFTTKLATGKLYAIDSQVDVTTGTIKLKAVFDNDDLLLFPNQFVNARLLVDTIHNAVVIPSAAVQHGPNGDFVYVVRPDDRVDLRTVVSGHEEAGKREIVTGLVPGEIVVTDGIDKLKKDAAITTLEKEKEQEKAGKREHEARAEQK